MDIFQRIIRWSKTFDDLDISEYLRDEKFVRNVKWQYWPSKHIVIDDIFNDKYAQELNDGINRIIKEVPLSEIRRKDALSRITDYDAYGYTPKPDLGSPWRLFYSREWHGLFKKLSGIKIDDNVMTTIHHHKINSESGYVHADFGKYAFKQEPISNMLNHWNHNSIYQGGGITGKNKDITKQDAVVFVRRALALLYYFGEEKWDDRFGGETAFFEFKDSKEPLIKIPPKPNSLLVFQITPKSFHAFQQNKIKPRNSIVQWFHEPIESMDGRLGLNR